MPQRGVLLIFVVGLCLVGLSRVGSVAVQAQNPTLPPRPPTYTPLAVPPTATAQPSAPIATTVLATATSIPATSAPVATDAPTEAPATAVAPAPIDATATIIPSVVSTTAPTAVPTTTTAPTAVPTTASAAATSVPNPPAQVQPPRVAPVAPLPASGTNANPNWLAWLGLSLVGVGMGLWWQRRRSVA